MSSSVTVSGQNVIKCIITFGAYFFRPFASDSLRLSLQGRVSNFKHMSIEMILLGAERGDNLFHMLHS